MKAAIGQARISTFNLFNFFGIVALMGGAVLIFQHYMDAKAFKDFSNDPAGVVSTGGSIPQWEEKGLEAFSAMSGLLTTLGTALLGGLGFLLSNARQVENPAQRAWSACGAAACACVSIYFGYVVHLHVLWAISLERFDPYLFAFIWPSRAQFYMLLLAVFFFALFAFHELNSEGSK